MRRTLIAIAIAAAVAVPSIGQAKTFRWAAQGDILTFDPPSQNEGMTIAAIAVGATRGYIYLRSEYPHAHRTLQRAILKVRPPG